MARIILLFATLVGVTSGILFAAAPALGEPADIDAAARGVVRVVIIGEEDGEVFPVSHGTGFAVSSTHIVTNAHVVREVVQDPTLRIGIVPAEGEEASDARPVALSPRNDLALVQITGSLRLAPLTIAGNAAGDSGEVSAVGYPRNVDMAQGLNAADIFRAQPPVKSRGFISGRRPSRLFDTILHTAPIAAGNSGGPLLDGCGRVLGVNSFGADSDGTDAEFYFAVSTRELLPFLRANDIEPRVNTMPCRSLAELDEAERMRIEREQAAARADLSAAAEVTRQTRERAQLEAEQSVAADRENAIAMAAVLLLIGIGAGLVAWQAREAAGANEKRLMIAGTISAAAIMAALALWFTRPGLDEIDRRVSAALNQPQDDSTATPIARDAQEGTYLCTLDLTRSRITGDPIEELEFDWRADGCVNERTQYGLVAGDWSRLFVPNEEDAVSVNRFDPDGSDIGASFRVDRYLLGRTAMSAARTARGSYTAPACETPDAANRLGDMQGSVSALLPDRPNERLVYRCELSGN